MLGCAMIALSNMCAMITPSPSAEHTMANTLAFSGSLISLVKKNEHLSKMSQLSLLVLEQPVLSPAVCRASTCPSGMYRRPVKSVQRSG